MKSCSSIAVLLLACALATLVNAGVAAADDPPEGRVPLVIKATDPEGKTLQFTWRQKEGPKVDIADPHAARFDKNANKWVSETYFVPTLPGRYVFEAIVKNEAGQESSKSFVQEILPAVPLPEANPGANLKKKVGEKVSLSGQDSKAFGNRAITRYEWAVRQAPGDFTLSREQATSRQFDFVPKTPGKYIFELKVFDGKYWSEPPVAVEADITPREPIKIDADPTNPVELIPRPHIGGEKTTAKAIGFVVGGDKPFHIGDKVELDGSRSIVNEADKPEFVWFQLDKDKAPLVKTFKADTGKPYVAGRTDQLNFPVQSFIAAEDGTYRFALQIKLADGSTVESEPVSLQVGTGAPVAVQDELVAVLTANKTAVPVGQEVTLDGSKSHGAPNAKLEYVWMQVPGKNFPTIRGDGTSPIARASGAQEGEYAVILVVKDGLKIAKSEPFVFTVTAGDKPPVIDLDKTLSCNVGETINIEARITDPQGYPVTVQWTCLEPKEMNARLAPVANLKRFQFVPQTPGTFLFKIDVTSSKGLTATAQIQVGVKDAAQLKPTAVITGPERANVGDKVTLSAATSHSPNRTALSYTWREDAAGGAKIKGEPPRNAKEWTFTVTEPGRVLITLIVNDGKSDSEPAKFAVDVAGPKVKPVAKISGQRSIMANMEAELSGEGSTAPDNGALQYFWSQPGDGGPEIIFTPAQRRGKVLRFLPPKAGTYVINLVVTDQNNERSDPEQFTLEVKGAPATPPTAAAVVLNNGPLSVGKEVRISAKDSISPSNAQLSYKWKQTKGPELVLARDNTQEISVTPSKPGTYEFQLVVSDKEVDSAPYLLTFTVAAGALPKAVIGEIVQPSAGSTVILDGSGSKSATGAGGDALQYDWKQVKGEPVRLPIGDEKKAKIQFIVPAEGEYVWELRVADAAGESEPDKISFTAKGQGKNQPPVAIVDKPVITTEVGVDTPIDASKSNDPDNAPNKTLTFVWRRGEQVFKETGPVLKFIPPVVGTLQFTVQAFDGKDYSQPCQVTVNVVAPGVLPVAKPVVNPNPAVKATRPPQQNRLIILDGTASTPPRDKPDRQLTYTWKQTEGDNLTLSPTAMAKDRVGLYIYKPGTYKFQLTVNDNEHSSVPVEVELKVVDE
jgi:hypothetical protein